MNDPMMLNQVTLSAIAVYLLQLLKKTKYFPWINQHTAGLNRLASALLAACTAAGINATFADGTLTVSGITAASVLAAVWAWTKSFALQEMIYQATANKLPAASSGGEQ